MTILPVFLLAFSAVLAVAAIGVSLFAVWRARVMIVLADERAGAALEGCRETAAALQKSLGGLQEELRDLRDQPPASLPGAPRAGLNLSKRSQVLRMHRQGDQPDRIAAALGVPLQEVDLLIKVHRIVIAKL
jgi:hypothetical protein